MKDIYLTDTLIYYPQSNCSYHIKDRALQNGELIVTFTGEIEKIFCYDISSDRYKLIDGRQSNSKKSLVYFYPKAYFTSSLTQDIPLVQIYSYQYLNVLLSPFKINISVDTRGIELDISGYKSCKIPANTVIKQICQDSIKNLHLEINDRPIFLDKNKVNGEFLNQLFQSFLSYNKNKLKDQLKSTDNFCHIRAHFVSLLLNQQGIDTLKVTKLYYKNDWEQFSTDHRWGFHTATMIIDNKHQPWVWDPWMGSKHQLLSLTQWIFRPNEPNPYKITITNKDIIFYNRAIISDDAHPREFVGAEYLEMMENMFYKALPIPTNTALIKLEHKEKKRLLSNNRHLLFPWQLASKSQHSDQKDYHNQVTGTKTTRLK